MERAQLLDAVLQVTLFLVASSKPAEVHSRRKIVSTSSKVSRSPLRSAAINCRIVVCITLPKVVAALRPARMPQTWLNRYLCGHFWYASIAEALSCSGSKTGGRYRSAQSRDPRIDRGPRSAELPERAADPWAPGARCGRHGGAAGAACSTFCRASVRRAQNVVQKHRRPASACAPPWSASAARAPA